MDEIIFDASTKEREKGYTEEEKVQVLEETVKVPERHYKVPAKKREELLKMYSHSNVRESNDYYHKTQEEINSDNKLDYYRKKISSHKNRYNHIDQYIEAMRVCWDFIWYLAESESEFMKPEKFVKKVLRGKIKISGFQFPVYKGSDRKSLNKKVLFEYIYDKDKDPKELTIVRADTDPLTTDEKENPHKYLSNYFSPEQIQAIFVDSKKLRQNRTMPYDEEYDGDSFGVAKKITKKQYKKLIKIFPEVAIAFKEAKRQHDMNSVLREFSYELDNSAFSSIADMDDDRGYTFNNVKVPKFKGNILNRKDYKRYMMQLDEYEQEHTYVNYHGQMISLEDYREVNNLEILEELGYNVSRMSGKDKEKKKFKKAQNKDRKREKELREELSKVQKRMKKRKTDKDPFKINTKQKKEKPKKKSKKAKRQEKVVDNLIIGASGTDAENYDAYQKMMMDMSWGYDPESID